MINLESPEGSPNPPSQIARLSLRPPEAARALGIGQRLLWEKTNCGQIPCVRLGRCVLYPVALLEQWLAEQAEQTERTSHGHRSPKAKSTNHPRTASHRNHPGETNSASIVGQARILTHTGKANSPSNSTPVETNYESDPADRATSKSTGGAL